MADRCPSPRWDDGERFWLREGTARLLGPTAWRTRTAWSSSWRTAGWPWCTGSGRTCTWPCSTTWTTSGKPTAATGRPTWLSWTSTSCSAPALAPFAWAPGLPRCRPRPGCCSSTTNGAGDGSYASFAALLDPAHGEVVSRLPEPILEPELDWERQGDVDNVIFVQGAHRTGDDLYIIYGAADRYVAAARLLSLSSWRPLCAAT